MEAKDCLLIGRQEFNITAQMKKFLEEFFKGLSILVNPEFLGFSVGLSLCVAVLSLILIVIMYIVPGR